MKGIVWFKAVAGLALLTSSAESGWAWSVPTHELLSARAADVSVLNTGALPGLGFQNLDTLIAGIDFESKSKTHTVREWIQGGARFEDAGSVILGTARFNNHFHNPLRLWPQAGLNDLLQTGSSALVWAQDPLANPDWSWQGVRQSYAQALTLETKAARESQFARVFAGLGHLIHLIQDMSQPAHVRNDGHPVDGIGIDGIETWALHAEEEEGGRLITGFAQTPRFPSLSLGAGAPPGGGYEPITEFWDTDQGSTQTFGAAEGLTVGLAEYTNANYFSEDTIAATDTAHQFPSPSVDIAAYSVCAHDPPPGSFGLRRWYISRSPAPCPDVPDHFLAQSLTRNVFGLQPHAITPALTTLDDRVMEDYARDLIPRAVGYSAKLIDYFFRGDLTVEVIDSTHVRVVNGSADPMNQGTIQIFYDTKDAQNRVLNGSYTISSVIAHGGATADITITPPPSDPTNPASNLTPGRYGAVFLGTLGAEENAVIGVSRFQWQENWDYELIIAPHNWYQTTLDPNVVSPSYGGERTAVLLDDALSPPSKLLSMRNYRPAGVPGTQLAEPTLFQWNETLLGRLDYPFDTVPAPHYDTFPIALLPDTELQMKIDTLTASFPTPAQQCLTAPWEAWYNGAVQHLVVEFNYGDYALELSVLGQQADTRKVGPSDGLIALTVGQAQRINLMQALRDSGVPVDQIGIAITGIKIEQQLLPPCQDTTIDQEQVMEIDYLRFVDVPPGTP